MEGSIALVGDLGGTNCRVRLVCIPRLSHQHEHILIEKRYLSNEFSSLESILRHFLQEHNIISNTPQYPTIIVVCVAGPTETIIINTPAGYKEYGTQCFSTNLQWVMNSFHIANALHVNHRCVSIMNDFEGVGYGILGLKPHQYVQLLDTHDPIMSPSFPLSSSSSSSTSSSSSSSSNNTSQNSVYGSLNHINNTNIESIPDYRSIPQPKPDAPIAVIGPGTGLGEAYLTCDQPGGSYTVHSSEGGHSTYAPVTLDEVGLVKYICMEYNCQHISWERVCSGIGIRSIYRYYKSQVEPSNIMYYPENIYVYNDITKPHVDIEPVLGAVSPAAVIFEMARQGDDVCINTVNCYLRALSRECGNLAATLLSYGGIYIAGGMGAKIRWALDPTYHQDTVKTSISGNKVDTRYFINNVSNKGRIKPYIDKMPIYLVLIDEIGLLGSTVIARRISLKMNTSIIKVPIAKL